MRDSYLDYAMSVIVSRALPDVRDGLKPVQRRMLFGMQELGVGPNSGFKKTARIVGEVMGKFHPHGDAPIYDTLVRLAQPFTLRYPLITGQGNFGSIDGDPPAQMRYTEARLAPIATEMLADLDRNTVDFQPNFDDSVNEPVVLPSRLPNLLLNGSTGIAVGMATSIPPHNLNELCNALVLLIDEPGSSVDDLMQHVHGPDFPTRGRIFGHEAIREAYATGRGKVTMRGVLHHEETANGRLQIIVDELPYQVNKSTLILRMADLVRARRIEGISDLRDESDRDGMRIVVELSRTGLGGHGREPALPPHGAAIDLRRQHAGARSRAAADGESQGGPAGLHRAPPRGHPETQRVRPREGPGSRPRARGPAEGARASRRGDCDHPRIRVRRRREASPHGVGLRRGR